MRMAALPYIRIIVFLPQLLRNIQLIIKETAYCLELCDVDETIFSVGHVVVAFGNRLQRTESFDKAVGKLEEGRICVECVRIGRIELRLHEHKSVTVANVPSTRWTKQ